MGASLYSYGTGTQEEWAKVTSSSTFNPYYAIVDIFNFSIGSNVGVNIVDRIAVLRQNTANTRNGKGVIYVAGAGNDNSSVQLVYNLFSLSAYIMPISAINPLTNRKTNYSDYGVGLWLSTYSSIYLTGNNSLKSTDLSSEYIDFGSTSGAAPIVSAAIALMLEVNTSLTCRVMLGIF